MRLIRYLLQLSKRIANRTYTFIFGTFAPNTWNVIRPVPTSSFLYPFRSVFIRRQGESWQKS